MKIKLPSEVKNILSQFMLNVDQCRQIMELLENEMVKGLSPETQPFSELKMFPSYVTNLPSGKEEGQYLALDLGGTNYRVLFVTLKPGETPTIVETTYAIPQEKMTGDGVELFDYIAQTMADFISSHKIVVWPLKLGFTFSFPCIQEGLNKSILYRWTKGFSARGCEGNNVAVLLQSSIDKLKLDVKCVAVINDTVGTLTSCALQSPKCGVGVIIGTGTNASYVEEIEKVKSFKGSKDNIDFVVINTEWGAFGDKGSLDKFRTKYDIQIDEGSINPKQQIFEKMSSGMYLGEIVRLILLDLINKRLLFRGIIPPSLQKPGSFHTKYVSEVERDPEDLFYGTHYMLTDDLNVTSFEDLDAVIVRAVCSAVATRAARLIGTGIACLLNRIDKKDVTVGIDGSLFKFHTKFPERMTDIVHQLKKPQIKFVLRLSVDGSGKGAAAIAASTNLE